MRPMCIPTCAVIVKTGQEGIVCYAWNASRQASLQVFCKAFQRKLCVQVKSQMHPVMPDVSRSRRQMAAGWMSQQVQMRLQCFWGPQQSRRQLAS